MKNLSPTVKQGAQIVIILFWNIVFNVKLTQNNIEVNNMIKKKAVQLTVRTHGTAICYPYMGHITRKSTFLEVNKHALLIADEPSFIVSKFQVSSFKIVKFIRKTVKEVSG